MWGAKTAGGYSDNLYRDRNAGGFDSKSRCCCFYLSKSVIVIMLTAVIIAAGAGSVLSVVFGYSQRWTYVVNRNVTPAYNLRTGWLFYTDNRGADKVKLDVLSKAVYILGIICLVMNALSAMLALFSALRAICGRLGRGYTCFSVIYSILLAGSMIAYYIVTALQVYKYQNRIGSQRFPWPDWAWCLGAGAALLWLISAWLASVMPKKSKYYQEEMEFQRQRADPNRPYQIPPSPAQGTPVNGFVPSNLETTPSNRPNPPMASQENTDYGEAPVKKSFMPSWTKKGSYNTSNEPNLPTAGRGNLRDRADEIRDRYRTQHKDVELGDASERPKSAW